MTDKTDPLYSQAVAELEARGVMPEKAPSLDPMLRALERFSLPGQDPYRTVIVAGTNGKGTTAKALEALLLSAGERVGLYTSPHLVTTRERIRIDGKMMSEERFVETYRRAREKTVDLRLSHFEMLTVMAALNFWDPTLGAPTPWTILEVGLGGLWDATNAIPHHNAVITRLGFDHMDLLGPSLPDIARAKFGVVSEKCRVVYAPLPPEVFDLKNETQRRTDSTWMETPSFETTLSTDVPVPQTRLKSRWGELTLSLPGKRSAENVNLALTTFFELGFDASKNLRCLETLHWPCRMQAVSIAESPCPVYLSGDHNPQGMESLHEILKTARYENVYLVAGIGKTKDVDGMLKILFRIPRAQIFLTKSPFRGAKREDYGAWIQRCEGFSEDPSQIFKAASARATPRDLIVITGSLYLCGLFLSRWNLSSSL